MVVGNTPVAGRQRGDLRREHRAAHEQAVAEEHRRTVTAGVLVVQRDAIQIRSRHRTDYGVAESRPPSLRQDADLRHHPSTRRQAPPAVHRPCLRAGRRAGGGDRRALSERSASAFADDRQRAIACGMNDFAPKPIELNGLRAVLEKWIPGFVPTFVEKKPSPVTASRG